MVIIKRPLAPGAPAKIATSARTPLSYEELFELDCPDFVRAAWDFRTNLERAMTDLLEEARNGDGDYLEQHGVDFGEVSWGIPLTLLRHLLIPPERGMAFQSFAARTGSFSPIFVWRPETPHTPGPLGLNIYGDLTWWSPEDFFDSDRFEAAIERWRRGARRSPRGLYERARGEMEELTYFDPSVDIYPVVRMPRRLFALYLTLDASDLGPANLADCRRCGRRRFRLLNQCDFRTPRSPGLYLATETGCCDAGPPGDGFCESPDSGPSFETSWVSRFRGANHLNDPCRLRRVWKSFLRGEGN